MESLEGSVNTHHSLLQSEFQREMEAISLDELEHQVIRQMVQLIFLHGTVQFIKFFVSQEEIT